MTPSWAWPNYKSGSGSSTSCNVGSLTLDAPHFGVYRGRIFAWELGIGERSAEDVDLVVDEPIVRWNVATPR